MILVAILRFACWEAALFAAAIRLAALLPWRDQERWLAIVAIQVTLESSIAAVFSFAGLNSQWAYWLVAAGCAATLIHHLRDLPRPKVTPNAVLAALVTPLILLSFKPVEEIDSINYLHYLIDWMANRATPYTFATNYVAFWELSFLPTWMVTRVDFFFPLLAGKAVVLMALALWLVGRELNLPRGLLVWAIAGCLAMQHYWFGPSGVPTLKNDVVHGIGFVLMALVAMRAARGRLSSTDLVLLALGAAFGAVKYTGIFQAGLLLTALALFRRVDWKALTAILASFLLTSGHYYLHNLLLYGSPFYPFQINLGPLHLPGTADLSNTSILYSLHNPELWRILFAPVGGLSPAGLLFPLILAAALPVTAVLCLRSLGARCFSDGRAWLAFALLCGWMLYFRSVFSASASPGDLSFLRNGLNSIRYVDGVLAVSELLLLSLVARLPWLAGGLVAVNLVGRLVPVYGRLELFPPVAWVAAAIAVLLLFLLLKSRALIPATAGLIAVTPWIVQHNRQNWTTYWNDLKPALAAVHGEDVAELGLPDGGYFAGHLVVAGNPVDPRVRSLLPEELAAIPEDRRPRYLAVLVTPGSEVAGTWEARYGAQIRSWGYREQAQGKSGAVFERDIAGKPAGQLH